MAAKKAAGRGQLMRKLGAAVLIMMFMLFAIPLLLLKHKDENIRQDMDTGTDIEISVYMEDLGKTIQMNLEEYVLGVVAGEMPASFHIEALKAQALAARTYTLLRMPRFGGEGCSAHPGADICTDPAHCQAYRNPATVRQDLDKLKQAVRETAGEVIVYNDKLIDAVFHSTSGGKTENSEDIWPNKVPYLRSVVSLYEEHSPKYITRQEVSVDDFVKSMQKLDPQIRISKKNIKNEIKVLERSEGGRITQIKVGNKVLKGTDVRTALGLNSANFNCTFSGNKIIFTVIGNGHGIGLSQYGADGMAKNGSDYKEILHHYYQGVEIVSLKDLTAYK